MSYEEARKLFFKFDGSKFHLWHDGKTDEFNGYHVPKDLEDQWLAEMTLMYLAKLDATGNWWTIQFLESHRDFAHLDRLLQAVPLGRPWERCAYLEFLVRYARACFDEGQAAQNVLRACRYIEEQADLIRRRVRASDMVARVEEVRREAEALARVVDKA